MCREREKKHKTEKYIYIYINNISKYMGTHTYIYIYTYTCGEVYCKCAKVGLQSRMTIPVFTGNECCSLDMVLNVFIAEHAPCEHIECRLGMVEAPRCRFRIC